MSSTTDERLRESFRERMVAERKPACPDEQGIWSALSGDLGAQETREIVDHTAACPDCAELWRLAREMGAMDSRRAGESRARRNWLPVAVAAVLIMAVTALWWTFGPEQRAPSTEVRAGERDEINNLTDEARPLSREAVALSWTGPDDATYSILVTTQTLERVSRAAVGNDTRFTIPESDLEGVPPGTTLVWQVTAHRSDGSMIRSKSFLVTLE